MSEADEADERDILDPAALLRSLDPQPAGRGWRLLSVGIVALAVLLVFDAAWRALGHGEWIRLPGIPLVVLVAGVAGSAAWERGRR